MSAGTQVRGTAERVADSSLVDRAARLGLAARTLVWTTIALLALAVAAGHQAKPDQSGALGLLRRQPFGVGLLAVAACGFAAYGLYRALVAALGPGRAGRPGRPDGGLQRAQAAAEAVLYLGAAATTVSFVLGSGSDSEAQTGTTTARLMALPAGRWLVGLVGLVVVGVGAVMAYRAVTEQHARELGSHAPASARRPAVALGAVGMAGRGAVIGLVGVFLLESAARFDPGNAKGLDQALQTLSRQPFGTALLVAAGLALLAYGAWSLAETLWGDV